MEANLHQMFEQMVKQMGTHRQTNQNNVSSQVLHMTQSEINQSILEASEYQYQKRKEIYLKSSEQERKAALPPNLFNEVPNLLPPLPKSKYNLPMSDLKEITARELQLKRNEGFYLKGKIIKKPWKFPGPAAGVNLVCEDKNGDLVRGIFYNAANTEDWSKLEEVFYYGREVVILHPFYRIGADRVVNVRVENRYEFFFSDETQNKASTSSQFTKLLEESKSLKDEANKLLKTNKSKALEKYHKSLEVFLKQNPRYALDQKDFFLEWKIHLQEQEKKQVLEHFSAVFSNCSLVYIEKEQPLLGLYYANFSSWCNPDFFKARLRKAKAQIDILHPYEALDYLEDIKTVDSEKKFEGEIKQLIEEANKVIKEYSSNRMIVDFLNNQLSSWNDQKSYLGPIEIHSTGERGRGFVAKRNIKKGEILLIECGFVYGKENPEFSYNLLTKLNERGDLKPLYMNLFPSSSCELPKYLKEEVKENMRETEIKLKFHSFRMQNPKEWKNFDENEISDLLLKTRLNAFGMGGKTGVYPNLCLFNHSCDPNTSVWFSNSKILLLAQKDISQEEEIYVSYTSIHMDTEIRKDKLLCYGFECACVRCQGQNGWKEKESQVTGLKCPHCQTCVSTQNGGFKCPKGCWKMEKAENDAANNDFQKKFTQIFESVSKKENVNIEDLVKFLQDIDKKYADYHYFRVCVLHVMSKYYAQVQDEAGFQKYFNEMVKIINFLPSYELQLMLSNSLKDCYINFKKDLSADEFRHLEGYGLPVEAAEKLWDRFKQGHSQGWFIPTVASL